MKKIYEKPSMVAEKFEVEDIVTLASVFDKDKTLFGMTVTSEQMKANLLNSINYSEFTLGTDE